MPSGHRIRRQRWHVTAASAEAAFSLRSILRQELETLNLAFEHALDAAADRTEDIHIPLLQLDLHITHSSDLIEQLSLTLAEQLGVLLSQRPRDRRARVETQPRSHLPRQRLLRYLRHGTLEWHDAATDAPTMRQALTAELLTWLDQDDAWESLCEAAPPPLDSAVAFFLRLVNLIDTDTIEDLLQGAARSPAASPTAARKTDLLRALAALMSLTSERYAQRYLAALRLAVYAADQEITPTGLLAQAATALDPLQIQHLQMLLAVPTLPVAEPQLPPPESEAAPLKEVNDPTHAVLSDHSQAQDTRASTAGNATTHSIDVQSPIAAPVTMAVFDSAATRDSEAVPGERVHAAGLVLLHSYLPRFFAACHIEYDSAGHISTTSLPRAAALLHRLVTGREDIHEFELGLIKPLLGLSADTPLLVAAGLLDDTAIDECESLLSAVIAHWQVLRSTSIDGLRISFLQRQGLLHDRGGHWQLHIEPEAFDVLLAQLPWSISLIKLPWMTKPIFTDWPTP